MSTLPHGSAAVKRMGKGDTAEALKACGAFTAERMPNRYAIVIIANVMECYRIF